LNSIIDAPADQASTLDDVNDAVTQYFADGNINERIGNQTSTLTEDEIARSKMNKEMALHRKQQRERRERELQQASSLVTSSDPSIENILTNGPDERDDTYTDADQFAANVDDDHAILANETSFDDESFPSDLFGADEVYNENPGQHSVSEHFISQMHT
jgi:hypothetical protein